VWIVHVLLHLLGVQAAGFVAWSGRHSHLNRSGIALASSCANGQCRSQTELE
jgi:hypothetical protein